MGDLLDYGFPTRLFVEWSVSGSGMVTLRHQKTMGSFEKFIFRIFRAPKMIYRPLDEMNSQLWLLMDGTRNFRQIVIEMDGQFKEKIAPAGERISKSISNFIRLGFVGIVANASEIDWSIAPTEFNQ